MSDPENFLARWSRRKRGAAEEKAADTEAKPLKAEAAPEAADAQSPKPNEPEPFDPAQLPPIDSIGAGSDIRAFLQKNVPADLTRAALRRAWAADPAIRDFVGLAENAWDFNAPDAIPGFGPLEMTDEVRTMLAEIAGEKPDAELAAPSVSPPDELQAASTPEISTPTETASSGQTGQETDDESGRRTKVEADARSEPSEQRTDVAMQQERPPEHQERPRVRGHGRALPK